MADLGTVGTSDTQELRSNEQYPGARLDPAIDLLVGVQDLLAVAAGIAQPWNQTGAGSGQPVVGASIQIG